MAYVISPKPIRVAGYSRVTFSSCSYTFLLINADI